MYSEAHEIATEDVFMDNDSYVITPSSHGYAWYYTHKLSYVISLYVTIPLSGAYTATN